MYFIIILAIVVLDQVVKQFVTHTMTLHQSIPVIENVFHITYIQNSGAAFSMLKDFPLLLLAVPLFVIAAGLIFLFIKRKKLHPFCQLSLAFIIGGGIGNLIDRMVYGQVVDFFDFRIFAVFNVADIFVCVGCGLLLIYVLFIDGKQKNQHEKG